MNFIPEVVIKSPGRINLIGEHLDYNGGHVLPAAIDLTVTLSLRKNNSHSCTIYSKSINDTFQVHLDNLEISSQEWHNYFLGVIHFMEQKHPGRISGFDCIVESNLPIGSGVSSSAALECGIAIALKTLFDIPVTDEEVIYIARDAEHHFVGTKCGIMDQFAVVRGKKERLIQLNCHDLSYDYVPAELSPYVIVLLNTNVSHNLATSEYNLRRQECEAALEIIRRKHSEYEALAHIPKKIVTEYQSEMTPKMFQRATYVIEENQRTLDASAALAEQNLSVFGAMLYASHKGLSEKYEVSCPELDFLVQQAHHHPDVIGARMMGGGFGGCTINLVHQDEVESFVEQTALAYQKKFQIQLTPHTVKIGDGVKRIQ
ncbi:MAG: galactokinase [Bacteroidota bacterium]